MVKQISHTESCSELILKGNGTMTKIDRLKEESLM